MASLRTRLKSLVFVIIAGLFVASPQPSEANDAFPAEWFFPNEEGVLDKPLELVGKPMPGLPLTDWMNGEITGKAREGKILVVDFWATWCGPCLRAVPKTNALYEKYEKHGVAVIGVCGSENGQDQMEATARKHDIRFPIAKDSTFQAAKDWRVPFWPTIAVVDRKGIVRAIGIAPEHVEDVVKSLLRDEGVDVDKPAPGAIPTAWLEGMQPDRVRLAALQGAPAPEFKGAGEWINSQPIDLASTKGKIVVLDFWATWCGPCIASIPKANDIHEKYAAKGVVFLGICHPRGAEKMSATAKEHGIKYPIVADTGSVVIDAYKVDSFPDYYVIDRNGKLVAADLSNNRVEDAIESLLALDTP